MYSVQAPKMQEKSRAIANSLTNKKTKSQQGFNLLDNRPVAIIQQKSLKQAGLERGLNEEGLENLNSTQLGPTQGHVYSLTDSTLVSFNKKDALIKAAELNGDIGTRYAGNSLQNWTDIRTQPLKDRGSSLQDALMGKIPGQLSVGPIDTRAPAILANLTKLSAGTIVKFSFDWSKLYKRAPKKEIKIQMDWKEAASKSVQYKDVNTQEYYDIYIDGGKDGLKKALKDKFPKIANLIDLVTVNEKDITYVSPPEQGNIESAISTAVCSNRLLDIDEISHIDPFICRISITASGQTLDIDFQHAEDWPGYVTKIKESGGGINAEMQTTALDRPTEQGVPDKYSNVHGDTGSTILTNYLDVSATDTREENEKKLDSHTKIAGEGSRFQCVRKAAEAGTLANDTYFYTTETGTNGKVNPGIVFSDLWKTWASEFDKKYNIGDRTVIDKLKNNKDGDIKLMKANIQVTENCDTQPNHHELK